MPAVEYAGPGRMQRIAVVAPDTVLRDVLVRVADSGDVELDHDEGERPAAGPAARLLHQLPGTPPAPALSTAAPDLDGLVAAGRADLVAGEAELAERGGRSVDDYELQMLYGVRPHAQADLAARGLRVRVYLPYGTEWFGYFMRRLAERPANLVFFARSLLTRG